MTTITTPGRSLEQKLDALDQANRIRSARALLKRTIRTDPDDARRVISNPTSDYRTMLLWNVLAALPRIGDAQLERFFVRSRISPRKTLAGLSERQREEALAFVTSYIATRRRAA